MDMNHCPNPDKFRFRKHFAITITSLITLAFALLLINIFFGTIEDGVQNFIREQNIRSKSQKTATIDLLYYIHSGDKKKYRIYNKKIDKLLKEIKALTLFRKNNVIRAEASLFQSLKRTTNNAYWDMKSFQSIYSSPVWSSFLPNVNLFRQAFETLPQTKKKLLQLQFIGKKIHSSIISNDLTAADKTQYLKKLHDIDNSIAITDHRFLYNLDHISDVLQWYVFFDFIAIGFVLVLIGAISAYFYIQNSKKWKQRIIGLNDELELIFKNTTDAILLVGKGGKIISSNHFANKLLLNDESNNLTGKNIFDVLKFEHREASEFITKLHNQKSWRQKLSLYKQDGSGFVANISASITTKKSGEEIYCFAFRDETKMTGYLTHSNISEQTYHDLLNSIQDGILIQDKSGMIIKTNPAAADILGYTQSELKGKKPNEVLSQEFLDQTYKPAFFEDGLSGEKIIFDRWLSKKDGSVLPVEVALSNGKFFGKDVVIAIIRDISDRHESIKELQQVNEQNQILLQEIHHRVKNNMALISGLINLQAFEVDDPGIKSILVKSQKRIHAVANIHELLYQSKDLMNIDFKSYMESMVREFKGQIVTDPNIVVRTGVQSIVLNVNQAIPTALMLNEILMDLVGNEHSGNKDPKIIIDIEVRNEHVIFNITGGNDLTQSISSDRRSLEFDIISSLIKQLEATIQTYSNGQPHYKIKFKRKENVFGSGGNLNLN